MPMGWIIVSAILTAVALNIIAAIIAVDKAENYEKDNDKKWMK